MIKIDKTLIGPLIIKALNSGRLRCNLNFHEDADDTLQRMLNVMNTNTYIQPHKHDNPDKREAFIILEGRVAIVEFDNSGNPTGHIILSRDLGNYGCEIAPKIWHTIICLENNSVLYEIKDGPYDVTNDKVFAPWAPEEGNKETLAFNSKLLELLKI